MREAVWVMVVVLGAGCPKAEPATPRPASGAAAEPAAAETAALADEPEAPAASGRRAPEAPPRPLPPPAPELPPAPAAQPFLGPFAGGPLRLHFTAAHGSRLTGTLTVGARSYPCVGVLDGEGTVAGSFEADGRALTFEVRRNGAALEFLADGRQERLTPARAVARSPFAGVFQGALGGRSARLTLRRQGETLGGGLVVGERSFGLTGVVDGEQGRGALREAASGAEARFVLTPDGDGLLVAVDALDGAGRRSWEATLFTPAGGE